MRRYIISTKIGKSIRKIRHQREMTQEEVADKLNIHVSTLGRIERGESNPPIQTINRIAQVLRVKPKELLP